MSVICNFPKQIFNQDHISVTQIYNVSNCGRNDDCVHSYSYSFNQDGDLVLTSYYGVKQGNDLTIQLENNYDMIISFK